MTEVVIFHHAQGRTPGVLAFAEDIRRAGHLVHVPDLYEGRTFASLDEGLAYAGRVGFGPVIQRGVQAGQEYGERLVYVGLSLGAMPAQQLTQTRTGAVGTVLVGSCVPPAEFGAPWPDDVPLQVHGMADDPIFAGEGDLDAARDLIGSISAGELFLYPGDRHLFLDRSLPDYDQAAADLVTRRVLELLAGVG